MKALGTLGALAVLLAAAAAQAEPHLDPRSQLQADVPATAAAADVDFLALFSLSSPRDVYLKVSPAPGNPVFANGTAGERGWWTAVELDGPSGRLATASTTGDPPVEFGRLDANVTYELRLRVHAPAGAMADEGSRALHFVLAEHGAAAGGSGGVLDESIGLHLTAVVTGHADAADAPMPAWVWGGVAIVVASAAAVALAVWAKRKQASDRE